MAAPQVKRVDMTKTPPETTWGDAPKPPRITSACASDCDCRDDVGAPTGEHANLTEHEELGLVTTTTLEAHIADANPHPNYATDGDLAAHVAAGDPHVQYALDADLVNELADHAAAANPHPGYLTPAEGDAAYSAGGHNHNAAYSATTHDHDGDYAALHAHPYAADDHTHPGGSEAFPVGSIFMAVVATNPGTLLGYGTWSAFGAGRMPVGIDAGQTEFDTVEETGGAKTVTLTAAQSGIAQHTHTQDAHTHTQNAHSHGIDEGTTDGSGTFMDRSNAAAATTAATNAATAINQNATAVNQNAGPTDAAQAHPNLPPYIVVYMWKRTA